MRKIHKLTKKERNTLDLILLPYNRRSVNVFTKDFLEFLEFTEQNGLLGIRVAYGYYIGKEERWKGHNWLFCKATKEREALLTLLLITKPRIHTKIVYRIRKENCDD